MKTRFNICIIGETIYSMRLTLMLACYETEVVSNVGLLHCVACV